VTTVVKGGIGCLGARGASGRSGTAALGGWPSAGEGETGWRDAVILLRCYFGPTRHPLHLPSPPPTPTPTYAPHPPIPAPFSTSS
jgi:hypothetical protein